MKKYKVCGTTTVNIYVEIEANSLEEAIEIADNEVGFIEFADGSIGLDCDYDGEITNRDWYQFEWYSEFSEEI